MMEIDKLKAAVIAEAQEESLRIIRQAKNTETEFMRKAHDKAQAEAHSLIVKRDSELRAAAKRRTEIKLFDRKKALIKKRLSIQKDVIDELVNRLKQFTATPSYEKYLENKLAQVAEANLSDDLTIFVSAAAVDKKVCRLVFKNAKIEAAPDIQIGGVMVRDNKNRIIYDVTLDKRVRSIKGDFLAELPLPD